MNARNIKTIYRAFPAHGWTIIVHDDGEGGIFWRSLYDGQVHHVSEVQADVKTAVAGGTDWAANNPRKDVRWSEIGR